MEFTKEQIIKASIHCTNGGECYDCPLRNAPHVSDCAQVFAKFISIEMGGNDE